GWLRDLAQLSREVDELAPQGVGAKQNERQQLERERRIVLQRRPELSAWQPSAPECEQLAAAFQAHGRELERQRKACELEEKQARNTRQQAERECQTRRDAVTSLRATVRAGEQELQRLGEES